MQTLEDLAVKYKTDKCLRGHGYTPIYAQHFGHLRREAITLLEIGVFRGASLRMWQDYFEYAKVVGIDNKVACNHKDLTIEVGDQTDGNFLQRVNAKHGPFDIIIDDGGHTMRQQIVTFEILWKQLARGGIYVVEDTHSSYMPALCIPYKGYTFIEYVKTLVDEINLNGKRASGTDDLTEMAGLNPYEQYIESMSIHRSIVFIQKR